MSSRFSSNSEAKPSELLENLEDMLSHYWWKKVSEQMTFVTTINSKINSNFFHI